MAKEKELLVRVFCEDGDGRMQLNTWPIGQRYDAYSWKVLAFAREVDPEE